MNKRDVLKLKPGTKVEYSPNPNAAGRIWLSGKVITVTPRGGVKITNCSRRYQMGTVSRDQILKSPAQAICLAGRFYPNRVNPSSSDSMHSP